VIPHRDKRKSDIIVLRHKLVNFWDASSIHKLGRDQPYVQVFCGGQKGDLHHQRHREPEQHLSAAKPAAERLSKRHGSIKISIPCDL
jgi:hypothetical protein